MTSFGVLGEKASFDVLGKRSFKNIVGKGESAGNNFFSFFINVFYSTWDKLYILTKD